MLSGGVIESTVDVAQNGLLRYDTTTRRLFVEDTTAGVPRSVVTGLSTNGLVQGGSSTALAIAGPTISSTTANRTTWASRFNVTFTGMTPASGGAAGTYTFTVTWHGAADKTIFTFTTPSVAAGTTFIVSVEGYLHVTTSGASGVIGVELSSMTGLSGGTFTPLVTQTTLTAVDLTSLNPTINFSAVSSVTNSNNKMGATFIECEILT